MFYDKYVSLCNARRISLSKAAEDIGFDRSSITKWKNKGFTPRQELLLKIADYFDVSVDYLLGNDAATSASGKVNDEDIKFALFGNDGEITDEMYDEVKRFAEYVKAKYQKD